jgi:acetolactate synthase-1/2/3 large subunit
VAPAADGEAVREAAERLVSARHPAIFAGSGVTLACAEDALMDLAKALGAPVITSQKGKGSFPENHRLSAGVLGLGGHLLAEDVLEQKDAMLVVGSSLNECASNTWDPRLSAPAFVQIDIDPQEIGKNYPVDVALVGDAKATLCTLASEVKKLLPRGGSPDPLATLRSRRRRHEDAARMVSDATPMTPQRMMGEIRRALPEDGMLFVDIGNAIIWGGHYFEARAPRTYFIDFGLASMGSAVAGVVGGKLAAPARAALALVGDAAFAMHGMEVHTAVELGIPAVWVVINNAGHGMVTQGMSMILGEEMNAFSWSRSVDHAAMARALGARGVRVEAPSELRAALRAALVAPGPTVIDVIVDPSIVPPTLDRRAAALSRLGKPVPVGPPGAA